MNNPDPGYTQAVRNLSRYIVQYAERDFSEIRDEFIDNVNLMMRHLEQHPELQTDWNTLEEVSDVIQKTYDVTNAELMSDVWEAMVAQDPMMPTFWN